MTVQELIDKLSEMPRDMVVCVKTYNNQYIDYVIDEASEVIVENSGDRGLPAAVVTIYG